MRNLPNFNFPAFVAGAALLRSKGYEVFSPAERDTEKFGITVNNSSTGSLGDISGTGFTLRDAMNADLDWITRHADVVVVLPGWENSRGATAEVAAARAIDTPESPCRVLTLEEALAAQPA
jgi:hypothetical protein